jgi:hypothetical protein
MFTKGVKNKILNQKIKEGLIHQIPINRIYDDMNLLDQHEEERLQKELGESHRIMREIGKEVPDLEKSLMFPAPEGSANLYYGKIRNGKTYAATSDILDLLRQGQQVYANWPVNVEDFDDRKNIFIILMNTFLFKKRFFKIPQAKNFHYINTSTGEVDGIQKFNAKSMGELIKYLNTLNNCHLFIDEAWRIVDSYQGTQMPIESRDLILVTGHKNRTVNLIAQRPTSVHVVARGNMSRFYKCVKLASWPWNRFARYEFQEMTGETVDETKEPESIKTYWGQQSVYKAYNTHQFGGDNRIDDIHFTAYDLTVKDKIKALYRIIRSWFKKDIND